MVPGRLEFLQSAGDFTEYASSPGDPFAPPPDGELQIIEGGGGDHVDLYRDLAAAIHAGRPPIAPGSQAIVTLELANAIIYSSHTGEAVGLPLDRAAYSELLKALQDAKPTLGRGRGQP